MPNKKINAAVSLIRKNKITALSIVIIVCLLVGYLDFAAQQRLINASNFQLEINRIYMSVNTNYANTEFKNLSEKETLKYLKSIHAPIQELIQGDVLMTPWEREVDVYLENKDLTFMTSAPKAQCKTLFNVLASNSYYFQINNIRVQSKEDFEYNKNMPEKLCRVSTHNDIKITFKLN